MEDSRTSINHSGLAGWITVAGLAIIVVAVAGHVIDDPPTLGTLWLILLCLGAIGMLAGGIPWSHTRGKRNLKTAFLGLVGAVGGGLIGSFLGNEAPIFGGNIALAIWAVLAGALVGAILFGSLGIWWGIRIGRRLK